jgi:hypothetical protein
MLDTVFLPLTAADLDRRLRAVDPGAVLISPRLLRRIIKHDRGLTGVGLQVPHRKCYVIDRDRLRTLADDEELGLEHDRELPAAVILLPRPDEESLKVRSHEAILAKYWRLLFHASVHRALAARNLTQSDIRDRVRRIGRAAFAEIHTVLRLDHFLLAPGDDAAVYEEFAALYLELSNFAAPLVRHHFPAIEDFGAVDRLLAEDVDGPGLLAATRPAGAGEPVLVVDAPESADCPTTPGWTDGRSEIVAGEARRYTALAEKATARGNDVRAALRHAQAACTAPGKLKPASRAAAEAQLLHLVKRLRPALNLTSTEAAAWRQALPPLLPPATRGLWPAEARLLYDLQRICIDHEQPVSAPHPGEWFYSGFKKPFILPLPDMPAVLRVKYLRRALGRLPSVRLGESDRRALAALLTAALHRAETELRDRFRPRIVESLDAVGLSPANYPERVSRDKLVEELLDIVAARGYLSQPDLRDALSRNQVKLPDLSGPREFFGGDPLLRANRELAVRMPGVYRRGEIYLRWLQRLSALVFGTQSGRWLTRNLLLPFVGAFLCIEGPLQIGHELSHLGRYLMRLVGVLPPLPADHVPTPRPEHWWEALIAPPWAIAAGGIFFWLLLHVPLVRRISVQVLGAVGKVVKAVLVDAPTALLRWPALHAILGSEFVGLLARFVLKPLLPALVTFFILVEWEYRTRVAVADAGIIYLGAVLFLTTRLSREVEEVTADWAVRRWEYVRNFLPGLVRLILDVFKQILEAIDRFLYAVDEWLRFRGGETGLTRVFKLTAGLVWGGISYVLRFILILFLEPQVNPIKHFPVVTISHKLLLPMIPSLATFLESAFGFGVAKADTIAFLIIGKIPGLFGFLAWEVKENWRLYRANRPADLQPVMIGHHGETMRRMLRPAFHSGTLPKLYAKLRRAERRAVKTGNWSTARRHLDSLHHAKEAIDCFAERELLAYVNDSPAWKDMPLRLANVEAGSNQVRIELACPAAGPERIKVTFTEQSGWLIAGDTDPGWELTDEQAAALELALTGFYKVGGADLLRADIETLIGPMPYDIVDEGLAVTIGDDGQAVYDLNAEPEITPRPPDGLPTLSADQLLFNRRPVPWVGWVTAWDGICVSPKH